MCVFSGGFTPEDKRSSRLICGLLAATALMVLVGLVLVDLI